MATRIFTFKTSVNASTSDVEIVKLQPPTDTQWTIVEVRPILNDAGQIRCFFDTELYHTFDFEDVLKYTRQHTLVLDLVSPHFYRVVADNNVATAQVMGIVIVVEEKPRTAT
ncbi:MAG: hypothetical protein QXW26_04705 [Candidatus Nitrosocaldus sp.]